MEGNQMNILNLFDGIAAVYAGRGIDLKFRVYRKSDGKEVTRESQRQEAEMRAKEKERKES